MELGITIFWKYMSGEEMLQMFLTISTILWTSNKHRMLFKFSKNCWKKLHCNYRLDFVAMLWRTIWQNVRKFEDSNPMAKTIPRQQVRDYYKKNMESIRRKPTKIVQPSAGKS